MANEKQVITTTFWLKRGNSEVLKLVNPTLAAGEPVFELDTGKLKIGDGIHHYIDLSYISGDLDTDSNDILILYGGNAEGF